MPDAIPVPEGDKMLHCPCGYTVDNEVEMENHVRHTHTAYDRIRQRIARFYRKKGIAHFAASEFGCRDARDKIVGRVEYIMTKIKNGEVFEIKP